MSKLKVSFNDKKLLKKFYPIFKALNQISKNLSSEKSIYTIKDGEVYCFKDVYKDKNPAQNCILVDIAENELLDIFNELNGMVDGKEFYDFTKVVNVLEEVNCYDDYFEISGEGGTFKSGKILKENNDYYFFNEYLSDLGDSVKRIERTKILEDLNHHKVVSKLAGQNQIANIKIDRDHNLKISKRYFQGMNAKDSTQEMYYVKSDEHDFYIGKANVKVKKFIVFGYFTFVLI